MATAVLLAGCAGSRAVEPTAVTAPPEPAAGAAQQAPVHAHALVFWKMIKGGVLGVQFKATNFLTSQRPQLVRPISVAARSHYVFIYDGGNYNLYRYDLRDGRLKLIKDLHSYISEHQAAENQSFFASFRDTRVVTAPPHQTLFNQASIYVMPNLNYFVADTYGGRVLYFDAHGNLLRVFGEKINLVHPVGVTVDQARDRVLVGDGRNDYILKFDFMGDLEGSMGARGNAPGHFINMMAMTADKDDNIYVVGRLGHRLQVLSPQGKFEREITSTVEFPTAVAVDRNGRVYVSNFLDNTISVFSSDGRLIDTVGGTGVAPGRFKRITSLWVDQDYLYVADSLNGRVQILRIAD